MVSSRFFVVAALLFAFLVADEAKAGPVEELVELASHPTDPDVFALRYQYGGEGLLTTRDGGESFALMCNSAIDPALTRGGPLAYANDGTLFMGIFQGLWQDDGSGCGWTKEPLFEGQWVSDLFNDPNDPDTLYLVTSSGNMGSDNGLYRRVGSGDWAPVGGLEFVLISRVHVVDAGGTTRIYQSILDGTIPSAADPMVQVPNYLLRYSEDDAASWTSFPFGETAGTLRLQAVDPNDPDRIVATLDDGDNGTRVIVSPDRGETWSDYLELVEFGGLTFAPDGRLWIGDAGSSTTPDGPQGIYAAASLDAAPTQLTGEYPVRCLQYIDDDTLLGCQRFGAGEVSTADGSYTESFKFTTVERFVSCDGVDMQAQCEAQLLGAYCGITHFPLAPVCEPYGVDLSALGEDSGGGGCAFDFDAGIGTGTLPDGGCIEPADGGTPTSTPTEDEPDPFDDLLSEPDAGTTPPAADPGASGGSDDGGCAVGAPGGGVPDAPLGLLVGAALALLGVRRRGRK